jgi:Glycosyl transferase family 4
MHFESVSSGSSREITPCAPLRNASITSSREASNITARVFAFNFLDGADGLAAGVTTVIALAYILFPGAALGAIGSALAWSLLGTSAAILMFNFPPAKIIMGDSGSSALGFTVAFLGLEFIATNSPNTTAATAPIFPLLVAALPLADPLFAILRRPASGHFPFLGDRRQFYDRLLAAGWTTRRVATTCYLLTGSLAGLAWAGSTRQCEEDGDGWDCSRSRVAIGGGMAGNTALGAHSAAQPSRTNLNSR